MTDAYQMPAPGTAPLKPAIERVLIGEDKTTRLHDRLGQFVEITPLQLVDLVNYAMQYKDFIKTYPNERYEMPFSDEFGNPFFIYGDEIDAIMRHLAEQPQMEEDHSGGYNFGT